jgi:ligand-binding sensor domain-containing protein
MKLKFLSGQTWCDNSMRILLLPFFILMINSSYGQAPYFQDYFLLRKNETVQVNTIFQDRTGFIWVGTNKGLFKYDGVNTRQYTKSDSLPDENVTALAQDSLDRIWIGHKNGELAILDREGIKKFNPSEGSAVAPISDILFDHNGNLWFSTLNDGLYYYTQERLFRLDDTNGMPDLFIYDIEEDREGKIWAGTDGGVVTCVLKDRKVNLNVISYKQGLPDNIIRKIKIDSDQMVWLGTEDAGIIQFNPSTGKNKKVLVDWPYGTITDMTFMGSQLWISTHQTGIVVFNLNTNSTQVFSQNEKNNSFSSINKLLKDRDGNIWIGSRTGLSRTYGDHLEYLNDLDPVAGRNVVALTVDKKNNIWFSTSEGLFRTRLNKEGKPIIEKQLERTPYQRYTVISLYTDSENYIWAGLYGEGVLRINPVNGKVTYLNKELRNGNILNITGKGQVVWLATLGGATQIKTSGENLDVKNFSSKEGLISDYIYQIFIDSKDEVWFATDGKGVDRYDGKTFHHYNEGLTSKVIYGFAEDSEHSLWVNAQADGIYKWQDSKFIPLSREVQLRDHNVSGFSSDVFGNLIIAHDLGIDIYDPKNNKVTYLGEELGIDNRKTNLNAVAKNKEGQLFIGTDDGIIIYSTPEEGMMNMPTPNIISLKLFNKELPVSSDLKFGHNQNNITVNYLGFWYQNPEGLSFQYKMDNYDLDWITTHDRFVIYSSLPPGDYTFHLKASVTGNFTGAKETSFHFVVHPPFWNTIPFYIFVVLLTAASGYFFIKYRERKLILDNKELELKVEERTQEIQKKNEEILSQAEEIKSMNDNLEELVEERTSELERKNKALEEYAFITAHNLRAPVASILGLINLISKAESKEEEKQISAHLKESADKLDNIVHSMTEAIEKGDS